MNELAYLGLAIVVSTLGSMVVWYRQRQPHSLQSGVDDFSRGLAALSVVNDKREGRGSATRR